MNRFRIVSIIAALACLVTGCASNQPAAPSSPPQATAPGAAMPAATQPPAATALPAQSEPTSVAPASSTTAAEPTAPPGSSRDFTQIDVCSLVSDQEVAQLDNGTVQSPAQSSDLGTTRGCTYGIQTADGGYDSVIIYVEPPDLLEASLELSDNKGTPVAGLGDQAYLQEDTDASQFRLLAERQGDFGVEVIGENSDALVAIAKLVFTRIQ
jgi:hypothetical protein